MSHKNQPSAPCPRGQPLSRRALLSWAAASATLCTTGTAGAERVPPRTQARLIAKIAQYDRTLVARQGTRTVLLVRRANDAAAVAIVDELAAELATIPHIAGGEHQRFVLDFDSPEALRLSVQRRHAAVVFLAGLGENVAATADALKDLTVLSTAPTGADAERGSVVGFDVVSGRVQLVVNLPRAKDQHVDFRPEFLRLARVIR